MQIGEVQQKDEVEIDGWVGHWRVGSVDAERGTVLVAAIPPCGIFGWVPVATVALRVRAGEPQVWTRNYETGGYEHSGWTLSLYEPEGWYLTRTADVSATTPPNAPVGARGQWMSTALPNAFEAADRVRTPQAKQLQDIGEGDSQPT